MIESLQLELEEKDARVMELCARVHDIEVSIAEPCDHFSIPLHTHTRCLVVVLTGHAHMRLRLACPCPCFLLDSHT